MQYDKQCNYIDQPGLSDSERRHYSKVYGINRSSVLVELRDFDVTENLPQDLMHNYNSISMQLPKCGNLSTFSLFLWRARYL